MPKTPPHTLISLMSQVSTACLGLHPKAARQGRKILELLKSEGFLRAYQRLATTSDLMALMAMTSTDASRNSSMDSLTDAALAFEPFSLERVR